LTVCGLHIGQYWWSNKKIDRKEKNEEVEVGADGSVKAWRYKI
jgi:hypothetical protein